MKKISVLFKKIFFTAKSQEKRDDFADFFLRAKPSERDGVFGQISQKVNQDQKKYIEKYEFEKRFNN